MQSREVKRWIIACTRTGRDATALPAMDPPRACYRVDAGAGSAMASCPVARFQTWVRPNSDMPT